MRESYRCIARVEKPHGKYGEVVTVPVHGLPAVLSEGMRVCIVPPRLKGDRWHEVESCYEDGRSGQLVAFSGVESIGDAEELRGRYILAAESELPEDIDLHDVDILMGRDVEDVNEGLLGQISEVMVTPANDVWVVDGEGGEVLLPVIEQVVRSVPEEGPIVVDATGFLSDWGRGK